MYIYIWTRPRGENLPVTTLAVAEGSMEAIHCLLGVQNKYLRWDSVQHLQRVLQPTVRFLVLQVSASQGNRPREIVDCNIAKNLLHEVLPTNYPGM